MPRKAVFSLCPFLFILFLFLAPQVYAQQTDDTENKTLTVFLDCRGCDENFIRSEISYVNFVRDLGVSQVHLLITRQGTGGGVQFTLNFIGMGDNDSYNNELIFSSPGTDTDDERRNGLVRYIKLGLVPFLFTNESIDDLDVKFTGSVEEDRNASLPEDPWNNWIFSVGGNLNFNGQEFRNNVNLNGRVRVSRITEKWKLFFNYNRNYNRQTFKEEDDETGETTSESFVRENQNLFGVVARSISDHWSVGSFIRGRRSTVENFDWQLGITPSLEYSLFPYREFARRQILVRYGILTTYNNYTDLTIFGELEELLLRQELRIEADFTQPWGSIEGNITGNTYLHDTSVNRLDMRIEFDFRVTRGLNINFNAFYSAINDQISLRAGDLTDEDILLNLRQQATSFSFGGSIGFNFTFGSLFNNVVNPRL